MYSSFLFPTKKAETLKIIIKEMVEQGSIVVTDE